MRSCEEMVRIPSATFCCWAPAWLVRSDLGLVQEVPGVCFHLGGHVGGLGLGGPATFFAAPAACPATATASSFAASCIGGRVRRTAGGQCSVRTGTRAGGAYLDVWAIGSLSSLLSFRKGLRANPNQQLPVN